MNTKPLYFAAVVGTFAFALASDPATATAAPAPAPASCCATKRDVVARTPATTPAAVAGKAASAPDACCAVPAAVPPCCAVEKPGQPLSAQSLYQLDATWTNDRTESVTLARFRGKPVVLAMFFAQCEYACPVLVHDLQRVREALPADVRAETRFVLVSFDVARDTPATLKAYREKLALDDGWTLLRGNDANVQELAMLLGVKFKQDARGQFAHSNLFTVLNRDGEIAHQHAGLNGDVSDAVKAVTLVAK